MSGIKEPGNGAPRAYIPFLLLSNPVNPKLVRGGICGKGNHFSANTRLSLPEKMYLCNINAARNVIITAAFAAKKGRIKHLNRI